MAGFQKKETNLYGIPSNYLNVVNTDFYIPTHLETDAITSYLPDGKPNATSALYNDIGIEPWPAGEEYRKDIYNITTPFDSFDSGDIGSTDEIKVLMSENVKPMMSINAGDTARLTNGYYSDTVYRMKVRGLLTKLPGFTFTAYKNPLLTPQMVTSVEQFQ